MIHARLGSMNSFETSFHPFILRTWLEFSIFTYLVRIQYFSHAQSLY